MMYTIQFAVMPNDGTASSRAAAICQPRASIAYFQLIFVQFSLFSLVVYGI